MMTRDDTKQILMVVQAAYPNFNPPDKTVMVDTWHRFLGDYTYDQVDAAVGTYIRSDTSGFAPDIGKVMEKLQVLFMKNSLNEMAAWGMVLRAIRNSVYHAEDEFDKLPAMVQKAVVSPGQLREWALAEDVDGTWMNVTQSNFMRTYRAIVAREKEMRKLSPEILKLVEGAEESLETAKNEPKKTLMTEKGMLTKECEEAFTPRVQRMLDRLKERLK